LITHNIIKCACGNEKHNIIYYFDDNGPFKSLSFPVIFKSEEFDFFARLKRVLFGKLEVFLNCYVPINDTTEEIRKMLYDVFKVSYKIVEYDNKKCIAFDLIESKYNSFYDRLTYLFKKKIDSYIYLILD